MPDSKPIKDSSLEARKTRFLAKVLRSRTPQLPAYQRTAVGPEGEQIVAPPSQDLRGSAGSGRALVQHLSAAGDGQLHGFRIQAIGE